jgi:hypothetical protein
MSIAARATVTVLARVLTACAGAPRRLPERALAPPAAVPAREFQQAIVADYHGRRWQLIVAGRITAAAVELAALTPEGVSLFTLRYDGADLAVQRQLPARDGAAPQLPPAQVIADLQLVYWPAAALNRAGAPHWRVDAAPGRRVLSLDGAPVERVSFDGDDPWRTPVHLEHLRYGYRLTITTLSATLLP